MATVNLCGIILNENAPEFDRFDICAAHAQIETDYHIGGILWERPSNERRNMSTGYQLHRMQFRRSRLDDSFDTLTDNAKMIYLELVERYELA